VAHARNLNAGTTKPQTAEVVTTETETESNFLPPIDELTDEEILERYLDDEDLDDEKSFVDTNDDGDIQDNIDEKYRNSKKLKELLSDDDNNEVPTNDLSLGESAKRIKSGVGLVYEMTKALLVGTHQTVKAIDAIEKRLNEAKREMKKMKENHDIDEKSIY